jgi:2-amino-4-ketopentanoate thiolase alpha subunit
VQASQVPPVEGDLVPAGSWVEIVQVVLHAGERAPNVPADTAAVDFVARIRGFLLTDAPMHAEATVRTLTGRHVTGRLTDVNPRNPADFGEPVPELLRLGADARRSLEGPQSR